MAANSVVKKGTSIYKISLMTFVLITLSALMSIRNFPTMGLMNWKLLVFGFLALVMFLVPASLVSAELATGWPETGGVYVWVREAFGKRWGFLAVWLQWFQVTIGFIGILTFIAVTISYVVAPRLADNKLFQLAIIIVVWWGMTVVNFRGLKTYAWISSLFVTIGVLIPAVLLIGGGLWWVFSGHTSLLTVHPVLHDFMPDFSNVNNLVLLVTFVFIFIGIEMTAVHAREIKDVNRNYPFGILIVGVLMTIISTVGALLITMIVPLKTLNLLMGLMQAFRVIYGAGAITTIIALMIIVGSIGQVSSWILGPVRGLLETARDGNLPKILQKENKNGIPVNLLIMQAIIITFWGVIYTILPGGVNSSFWMLFALTTCVYLVMYFFMYAAAISLRYKCPNVKRPFTIPGGKAGMWLVAGWGFLSMVFVFILALIPPNQIKGMNLSKTAYILIMLGGTIVVSLVPLVIYQFKKPSWMPESKAAAEKVIA
jgi:amino acid transporter